MKQDAKLQPSVSVIVLNYNGGLTTLQCIQSIENQSYTNLEIILVDNASTDGSPNKIEHEFPNVKIVRNSQNLGFAEGNNRGIETSTGQLTLLVNNDLILHKDTITNLVAAYSASPGIVGGLLYYAGTNQIWAYGARFDPLTGIHWQIGQGLEKFSSLGPYSLNVDYVPGALLLTSKSLLDKIGLLDDYFFLYGDDIDLALKIRRLGYSIMVTSNATSEHLVSQTVRRLERKQELSGYYLMNRNMFYIYYTQLPIVYALTATITQLVFLLFEIFLFKRPLTYVEWKFKALVQVMKDTQNVKEARKRIQRLGKLHLKTRLFELLKLAKTRGLSRTYYW